MIAERPNESDREGILDSLVEVSPDDVIVHKKRSLVMIEPDHITSAIFNPSSYDGKYTVRMSFVLDGRPYDGAAASTPGYPCTDLRLRNWGRRFSVRTDLNDGQLRERLQVTRIFLVMGLSRPYQNNCWPMVVGFHTCPDFNADLDFDNP